MHILFIGDIVGKPGREAIKRFLKPLQEKHQIDVTIANGENAAAGKGLTKEIADELYANGIEFLTMGNHVWDQRDIMNFIDRESRLIRPANYPVGAPGQGHGFIRTKGKKIGVLNLSGRVFLPSLDDPFSGAIRWINQIKQETSIIIVDFHAEATSEKVAMGWFLDGKVSAVIGTHTHIQTADARLLDQGTAYITDVGMTGPRDSVLGVKKEIIINRFLTQLPAKFELANGPIQLNAVVLDIDEETGKARRIEAIQVTGEK
ncbi:TIGR00282 family metallophosphoesterase [Desulfosporosinus meridiei]|uniref:Metallophosphoesterase, MG_246/BB_0505 family n=1 Tax=Desulfosporosinus meridiei (strain ATCC BAA-275 / DSM 13257 / KCTC 12902 / NCIMB 13706 / S10) TaxID=768704 RepID=J7IZZ0_DESMD|nr:TIGR00282 family metallophosphoesterase [Desulfosporosinus meridiei]AFQ44648.1 metallophosphoesterase, MG_246/BB_0505 family [Desulfosporosinus meridiei DSM 13257]